MTCLASVLSGLPSGNQCTPANFTLDVHAVLNVNEITNEALPVLGISPASPLELHDLVLLRGSPDSCPALDNAEALSSPEISPFKTFTTTKASLMFILAEPDVYIPGARRKDDWEYEDDKSEDHREKEDADKATETANYSYEDMILETDTERFVVAFSFWPGIYSPGLVLHLCPVLRFLRSPSCRVLYPTTRILRRMIVRTKV